MNNRNIALQLYTVRELTGTDMLGTLRQLREQGYRAVEFAGFGGVPVEEIKAELDRLGMRTVALHIGVDDLQQPEQTLLEAKTLGCDYLVVAFIVPERRTAEQARRFVEAFNRYGEICRDAGLRFAYHNHDFEFAPMDGTTIFDMLVEGTDPTLVNFELDVYWAQYAGVDPASLLRRLARRVPLLHAKDLAAGETRAPVAVGEGTLPWTEILKASAEAEVEWYIVEVDNPGEPLAEVETGLRNLERLLAES